MITSSTVLIYQYDQQGKNTLDKIHLLISTVHIGNMIIRKFDHFKIILIKQYKAYLVKIDCIHGYGMNSSYKLIYNYKSVHTGCNS